MQLKEQCVNCKNFADGRCKEEINQQFIAEMWTRPIDCLHYVEK